MLVAQWLAFNVIKKSRYTCCTHTSKSNTDVLTDPDRLPADLCIKTFCFPEVIYDWLCGMPLAAKALREQFIAELDTPMVAELLFAQVPDIVFCIKNIKGQYISANAAFAERLGLRSIDSILGKTTTDIFPPHLAATYLAQDESVLVGGKEINDRLELVFNRDGSLGWYLARKVPLMGKMGKIIGVEKGVLSTIGVVM